jgi:muramoyltetrapeptide carboxypeptidase
METILPPSLEPKDKVAIVAPARKISKQELRKAIDILTGWGLEVVFPENLFKEHHQFSGTDEQRAADFQWALDNPDIKAIFCARGGYGSARIIDSLDFSAFRNQPKWIVGYSDITVIHTHINKLFNISTIHGTMPINFATNSVQSLNTLKSILSGDMPTYAVGGNEFNIKGKSEGQLVGGNLSILYSLNGSESFPDVEGKILFIEDLDEYLYHVDRMVMNLKRAGVFASLSGLVVGGMTDMRDNQVPYGKTAEEIIYDAVKEYNYPVCFNFPAGHVENNLALITNKKVRLNVSTTSSLTFEV